MNKKVWYKQLWIWFVCITILVFFIVGVPVFISFCFLKINGDCGDVLQYYGTILSFIGTVSLGALALLQNDKLSRQNEKYRKMIESKDMPIFVVRIERFEKLMSGPKIKILNLSNNIAADFEILECGIKISEDEYFKKFEIPKLYKNFVAGNDEIIIDFSNEELCDVEKIESSPFELIFRYTDVYGRVHNTVAIKDIKDQSGLFGVMKLMDYII